MIDIIIILLAIVTIAVVMPIINWSSHLSMTESFSSKGWGWGTYKQFKREFKKIKWDARYPFTTSVFSYETDSEFHANIIKFHGKGMRMKNPLHLHLAKRYRDKYIAKHHKEVVTRNIVKW